MRVRSGHIQGNLALRVCEPPCGECAVQRQILSPGGYQGEGISVPRMRTEMGSPWSVSRCDTLNRRPALPDSGFFCITPAAPTAQQGRQENQVGRREQEEVPAFALRLFPGDLPVGDQAGHGGDQGARPPRLVPTIRACTSWVKPDSSSAAGTLLVTWLASTDTSTSRPAMTCPSQAEKAGTRPSCQ